MTDGAQKHSGQDEVPATPDAAVPDGPTAPVSGQPAYGQPAYGQQQPPQPQYGEYAQAPNGQAPYGQAPYGQAPYGQAPYGQPAWGQPDWQQPGMQQPGVGAPGWTPPPKPGIIPLRPLSFGTLLGAPFQMLKRNPKATFGSALLIQGIVGVATIAAIVPFTLWIVARVDNASAEDQSAVVAGSVGLGILVGVVLFAVSLLASALLQGVIVLEAARATLGEKLPLGALWKRVLPRVLPLVGWLLLLGIGFIVAFALIVLVAVLIFAQGESFLGLGIAYSVLGGLGLLVLSVWIYTKTLLVPCAIVLERLGLFAAIKRSWVLVRGAFWKVFGVNLLVAVIVNAIAQVVTAPLSLLVGFGTTLLDPNGSGDQMAFLVISNGLVLFVTIIIGAVASVVQSGTVAFLYIDRRIRTEALDLDLQRAVEARESGDEFADPYLPTDRLSPAAA
ncbi:MULTISPECIES: hypothetical protein [unclassified Leifsonia]|uniref:hypothetical protein n=1 Tax=unclassified Leifsonia TaxID=2663824 RepID=UPI0006FD0D37|nr:MULTISPECIES: hypothetical protein [unclassified Leifsonia]KQX06439.1 hypothetical protein ASC59_00725 [Leifsonia sp. Root1293]KRA10722.1 hypothetical protein ASD61_00725 [Leifsonia sp. Root60]